MLIAHYDTDQTMGIDEFKAAVRERCDPERPETMMAVGEELVMLANNRDLVARLFEREIMRPRGVRSMYSPQSCVIFSERRFYARLNFWPALPTDPRRRNILSRLYSYQGYHDHNFSFLTTNFFGPGYETDIYEYEHDAVDGVIGEDVRLRHTGVLQLKKGDIFLFEKGKDIHEQSAPSETSASINLILRNSRDTVADEQYHFDVERSRIASYVDTTGHKQNTFFGFARSIRDERTTELIAEIAHSHPARSVRAHACTILGCMDGEPAVRSLLEQAAVEDPAKVVRLAAQRVLDGAVY